MIVTAAEPRPGDRVQGGEYGEVIGTYSRFNTPTDRLVQIRRDGLAVYVPRETVYLLTGRLVTVTDPDDLHGPPAWEGPIERAADRLGYGRYPATSEDPNGQHHEGTLVVGVEGVRGGGLGAAALFAQWECSPACACQPFDGSSSG